VSAAEVRCAVLALGLAGCAVGPNYVRPAAPKSATYTPDATPKATASADGEAQRFEAGKLDADWWRLFENEKLDSLVSRSIADNPTLQSAQATLRQSQFLLKAGYGVFSPQVSGSFGVTREQFNPAQIGSPQPASVFNLFSLSASVSYAIDIWGGQRRGVEALRAQVQAQRYNVLGAYLILAGNVTDTAITLAACRAQVQATNDLIALEKDQVSVTKAQAQAGTVPFANVLSMQSELASTQATLPPLQEKIDQADHLLVTLLGREPAALSFAAGMQGLDLKDFKLPVNLPVSLPADLVRQRPDILLAEQQLVAANAQIGVALAAMLPGLSLSGTVGAENTNLSNLFNPASLAWSLGAGLLGPIFDGGTRWFQHKAAIEAHAAVLATYRQTVLSALAQVADTLRALEHDADAVNAQTAAVHAASDALQLTKVNYQSGTVNYLQLLIADEQYHQATLGYVQAQAQRLQDTVALYLALGGGWWNTPRALAEATAR
jgi:NodT family efflux transporter outer membrane factor (OMF) lipoprotein